MNFEEHKSKVLKEFHNYLINISKNFKKNIMIQNLSCKEFERNSSYEYNRLKYEDQIDSFYTYLKKCMPKKTNENGEKVKMSDTDFQKEVGFPSIYELKRKTYFYSLKKDVVYLAIIGCALSFKKAMKLIEAAHINFERDNNTIDATLFFFIDNPKYYRKNIAEDKKCFNICLEECRKFFSEIS